MTSQAARLQLQHGYENSGNELGTLFVDILTESKFGLTLECRNLINEIANAFESVPSLGVPFLRECLSLSKALGPRLHGDALLHKQLAMKLWRVEEVRGEAAEKEKEKGEERGETVYRSTAVLHFAMAEAPEALWVQVKGAMCWVVSLLMICMYFDMMYSMLLL